MIDKTSKGLEIIQQEFLELQENHNFRGILSLVNKSLLNDVLVLGDTPLVYLGTEDISSVPCISGNPYLSLELLTKKVIEFGHKEIVFIHDPTGSKIGHNLLMDVFRKNLAKASLLCNEEIHQISSELKHVDLVSIKAILDACESTTAIIAGRFRYWSKGG